MKPYRYHILLALAEGALHGAEIRRRVDEESRGEVTLYPATLYGALDELDEEGLIAEVEPDDLTPEQARWRFYDLTPQGRNALQAETARLERVLLRAREALGAAAGS